jgi:hypothetical protein
MPIDSLSQKLARIDGAEGPAIQTDRRADALAHMAAVVRDGAKTALALTTAGVVVAVDVALREPASESAVGQALDRAKALTSAVLMLGAIPLTLTPYVIDRALVAASYAIDAITARR